MGLSLQIERSGQFIVTWDGSNATQCGAKGTRVLHYEVRIVGSEDHLTPEGFIIDNNEIQAYFDRTYAKVRDFVSCEQIASKACRDFKAMFGTGDLKNVRVRRIDVKIAGSPQAGLRATWVAEERRAPAQQILPALVDELNRIQKRTR